MTHSAHAAYGYAELISDSSVRLTELYYDGAGSQKSFLIYFFLLLAPGPKTNWIVGTKATIGVDSNTLIIDKLTESGEVRNLKSYVDLNSQLGFTRLCCHVLQN